MNDEIKEILSLLNSSSWSNEAKQIEDYINNLQQAIKDTKDTADDMLFELKQENDVLKKKLDRRYYKNEYERIKEENERLKETIKEITCIPQNEIEVDYE